MTKFIRIDDNRKFGTIDMARKEANRICEKVKRESVHKGYAVQILIGISELALKNKQRVKPHLHIIIYASPAETVARMIVAYINDYQRKHAGKTAATHHECDCGYIPYIVNQSKHFRYYHYDAETVLDGTCILAEVGKINPSLFRKMAVKHCKGAFNLQGCPYTLQLPCNYNRDSRSHVGIPEREKEKYTQRRTSRQTDIHLITREEWLSKSPQEQARYYNSLHMKLSFFAYKLHMRTQSIIDDFECSGYYYDEEERRFITKKQLLLERIELILFEQRMQKCLINLDDIDD